MLSAAREHPDQTPYSVASDLGLYCAQCRQRTPWLDTIFCGIWSGSILFSKVPIICITGSSRHEWVEPEVWYGKSNWDMSWENLHYEVCNEVRLQAACSATKTSKGLLKFLAWENLYMPFCANDKGADQPEHPPSFSRAFVIHDLNK